ncbi:MAG: methyltransferase domain-containing protein [Desulfobacterales bacterium]
MSDPVNFQPKSIDPESISRDIGYAVQVGEGYVNLLSEASAQLDGKVVLEIGPGINFGSAMILLCHGAKKALISDLYLSFWDSAYHPVFYAELRKWLAENRSGLDLAPLDKMIEKSGYDPDIIACYESPLEDLSDIPSDSVDIIFSNAVLEHVLDLEMAFEELARISRIGALGFHQVDFRDHRDFSKPLEYLLMGDFEFEEMLYERHGECGNRFRPHEMQAILEKKGFAISKFTASDFASDKYLDEFIPRLKASANSMYKNFSKKELMTISGRLHTVKEHSAPDRSEKSPKERIKVRAIYNYLRVFEDSKKFSKLEGFFKSSGKMELVLSPGNIKSEKGYAFYYGFQTAAGKAYSLTRSFAGETLYEDDKPLPYPMALHDEIRAKGEGAYSMWPTGVLFSSTDNSDPQTNGRKYSLTVPASVYVLENMPQDEIVRSGL